MYNINVELTERQEIYLELLQKGYSHFEIGQMFGISRQRARKECVQAQRIIWRKTHEIK